MDDLRELLELLKSHNVQFLIIGAHAVGHHGYTRATKDVDVWVGRNLDNARRLAKALEEFGADIGEEGAASLASSGRKMIRLGFPPRTLQPARDFDGGRGEHGRLRVLQGRVSRTADGVRGRGAEVAWFES